MGTRYKGPKEETRALNAFIKLVRAADGLGELRAALVQMVAEHAYLEPDVKVQVLSRWAQRRLPGDIAAQPLQTRIACDWYRDGLKRLLESEPSGGTERAQRIRAELESLETQPQ